MSVLETVHQVMLHCKGMPVCARLEFIIGINQHHEGVLLLLVSPEESPKVQEESFPGVKHWTILLGEGTALLEMSSLLGMNIAADAYPVCCLVATMLFCSGCIVADLSVIFVLVINFRSFAFAQLGGCRPTSWGLVDETTVSVFGVPPHGRVEFDVDSSSGVASGGWFAGGASGDSFLVSSGFFEFVFGAI